MLEFIELCNIFSPTQFGFRKGKSTETALMEFTEFVQTGLTQKKSIGTIFMDLSKAFDVMDHKILKEKLFHYGFRGTFLDLLMSFLSNRKYFVHVNGLKSDVKALNIGVPQGSTLGPLLFLIFINDMKNCSNILKFIQFADDTTIMHESTDINVLNKTLEIEANKVILWFNSNKLIINLSKTNSMLFTNQNNVRNLNISLNNSNIECVKEATFLGVVLDNKLSWKAHVKHISRKISKSIAILKFVKYSFPIDALRIIYMALIFSHLNYCNLIWGSAYSTNLDPLIKLQKKAVRIVNKSGFFAHTAPIFNSLRILNVQQIFLLNCLCFMYKCFKLNLFPSYRSKMIKQSDLHPYKTRGNSLLRIPKNRLTLCINSFYSRGIQY